MFSDQPLCEQIERVGAGGAQAISNFCDAIVDSDIAGRISLICRFTDNIIADYKAENE